MNFKMGYNEPIEILNKKMKNNFEKKIFKLWRQKNSTFSAILVFLIIVGGSLHYNVRAQLEGFTTDVSTSGIGGALFGRFNMEGIGGGLKNADGTPMTEEQLLAAIEAYVESIAGQDLSDEAVVAGLYVSLGISDVPADTTTPEFAALATALNEARTGDKDASRALAESIAAAAQAATENPVSGDPPPPKTGDQPTADPSKEGTVDLKKDGENPGVVPEATKTGDPTESSADYVDGNPEGQPSDSNQNPPNSSEDQAQNPSQEQTNQTPAKTETEENDPIVFYKKNDTERYVLNLSTKKDREPVNLSTKEDRQAPIDLSTKKDREPIELGREEKAPVVVLNKYNEPDVVYTRRQIESDVEEEDQDEPEPAPQNDSAPAPDACAGNRCASAPAPAENSTNSNNIFEKFFEDYDESESENAVSNYEKASDNSDRIIDNSYSMETAVSAVEAAAPNVRTAESPDSKTKAAPQTIILPAAEAELAALLRAAAIELRLKTAGAKGAMFYLRRGVTAAPLYLGAARQATADTWEFSADLNANPLPNGNYYVFAQIDRGDGNVYHTTDVYIAINIAAPVNEEEKAAAEQEVKTSTASIEKSEEVIQATVRQTAAAPAFAQANAKERIENLAQMVRVYFRLESLREEKVLRQREAAAQIARLNGEIALLPANAIDLVLNDKVRARQYFIELEKTLGEEIVVVNAGIEKISGEIDGISDDIFGLAATEEEKNSMRGQIDAMREDIARREKAIIENRKILLRDTDGDGLLDGREIEIGTDLLNPDTDGDGLLDGDEVANGRDPLVPEKFAVEAQTDPSAVPPAKADVYKVEKVKSVKTEGGSSLIEISGRALPLSYVKIFIYSQPVIVAVKTDAQGRWTYTLDKPLDDGNHTVYATLINSQGRFAARSEVYIFKKTGDQIEKLVAGQEASMSSATGRIIQDFKFAIIIVVVVAVAAAFVAVGYLANRGAKKV